MNIATPQHSPTVTETDLPTIAITPTPWQTHSKLNINDYEEQQEAPTTHMEITSTPTPSQRPSQLNRDDYEEQQETTTAYMEISNFGQVQGSPLGHRILFSEEEESNMFTKGDIKSKATVRVSATNLGITCNEHKLPEALKMMNTTVEALWQSPGNSAQIVANHGTNSVQLESFQTLRAGGWLNDEVINTFASIVQTTSQQNGKNNACYSSYFFTCFFTGGLHGTVNYQNVCRWASRLESGDVYELSKLFCPININNSHWTLLVVDFEVNTINYYDSLQTPGPEYTAGMLYYLENEYRKKDRAKAFPQWTLHDLAAGPFQTNGVDCGVFVCATIFQKALAPNWTFTQTDIPRLRRLIGITLLDHPLGMQHYCNPHVAVR
jgi:hypothetical protein